MGTISQERPTMNAQPAPLSEGWQSRVRVVTGNARAGSPILPFDGRDPRAAEEYRIIRTKIGQYHRNLQILAVSSPQLGDGKSVTAVNLAGALSLKNDETVLLIDADLRRSALGSLLNLDPELGLAEVLKGTCTLEEAITRMEISGVTFYYLSAGRKRHNPTELLASAAWGQLCSEIRNYFDYCLIDTPPVGVVADYELIQPAADGVVMVVRPDHTNRTQCVAALQAIPKEKLVGVISNCNPDWFLTRPHRHNYMYYRGSE
jgi:capsular exopolysaccharide synthesis family protein